MPPNAMHDDIDQDRMTDHHGRTTPAPGREDSSMKSGVMTAKWPQDLTNPASARPILGREVHSERL